MKKTPTKKKPSSKRAVRDRANLHLIFKGKPAGRLTPLQTAFIGAYRVRGSILEAAKAAEMDRALHYRWLNELPRYAEAFAEAKESVAEILEDEAIRRAHEGWDEPVKYQGEFTYPEELDPVTGNIRRVPGAPPLAVRKFSDVLLQFLLKAMKPEKYRERLSAELTGKSGGPIEVSSGNLTNLTDEQLSQLQDIAKALTKPGAGASGNTKADDA